MAARGKDVILRCGLRGAAKRRLLKLGANRHARSSAHESFGPWILGREEALVNRAAWPTSGVRLKRVVIVPGK